RLEVVAAKKSRNSALESKESRRRGIPLLQVTTATLLGYSSCAVRVSGCKPVQGKNIPLPTGRQLKRRVCGIDGTNETGMASPVGPTAEITGAVVLSAWNSNCIISDQGGRRSRVL